MKSFKQYILEAVAKPFQALVIKKSTDLAAPFNVWLMSFDPKTRKITTTFATRGGQTRAAALKAAEREKKKRKLNVLDTKIFRQTAQRMLSKGNE